MPTRLDSTDFLALFASNVHDIKNSLSLLLGELDSQNFCTNSNCETVEKITQLKYQGKLVNDRIIQLLEVFKINNSQYTINQDYTNVKDFLTELVIYFQSFMRGGKLTIDLDCDEDLCWFFDPNLVSGAIHNALNNSFRYANTKILVSAKVEDDFLIICVDDDGRGFPQAILEQDSQMDSAQINMSFLNGGSTGLGLYFAHMVARLHTNNDTLVGYTRLENGGVFSGASFILALP